MSLEVVVKHIQNMLDSGMNKVDIINFINVNIDNEYLINKLLNLLGI